MNSSQTYLINGRDAQQLSVFDRGFAYGDGVFRTSKVIAGQPAQWSLHYTKLLEDCHVLGIVCPSAEIILQDIEQLFGQEDGVAKVMITRGESARGYAVPALAQPNRIVIRSDFPQYPSIHLDEGVSLHLCDLRLSSQPRLAGVKHLNRLENVMARMEWNDSTLADGLLLDIDGNAIECTTSNVFARFGKTLLTPDLSRCGVAGVTRKRIIENAHALDLRIDVTTISLERLMQANEIIICNSLFGAWQVRSLNGQSWPRQDLADHLRKILL